MGEKTINNGLAEVLEFKKKGIIEIKGLGKSEDLSRP